MKNNSECFDRLMQREAELSAKRRARKRVVTALLPVAACFVMMVCLFPMLDRVPNDRLPIDGSPTQSTAEAATATTAEKHTDTTCIEADVTIIETIPTKFVTVNECVKNTSEVILPNGSYIEKLSYEQIREYYGADAEIGIPDGYICKSADYSASVYMLDGMPFTNPRYLYEGKNGRRVYAEILKGTFNINEKSLFGYDYVIQLTDYIESTINGRTVIVAFDGLSYYAHMSYGDSYLLLEGTGMTEYEFIGVLEAITFHG